MRAVSWTPPPAELSRNEPRPSSPLPTVLGIAAIGLAGVVAGGVWSATGDADDGDLGTGGPATPGTIDLSVVLPGDSTAGQAGDVAVAVPAGDAPAAVPAGDAPVAVPAGAGGAVVDEAAVETNKVLLRQLPMPAGAVIDQDVERTITWKIPNPDNASVEAAYLAALAAQGLTATPVAPVEGFNTYTVTNGTATVNLAVAPFDGQTGIEVWV